MAVAVPGLILWGLCAPGIVLIFILKNRQNLTDKANKIRFGFLFHGYKSHLFYWEFIIIYRKIGIVLISVFLSTVSHAVQGQAAFLVLIVSFYVQSVYRPFEVEKLNKLEQMSILTAATTIYCGLLYLTGDMGEGMKLFLFALILLSNAVFLVVWLYGIIEAYALVMSEKRPKIAKWICFCFVKSRRFRKMATNMGINTKDFDNELGPEPLDNSTFMNYSTE